jgi:hypothetical protein
MAKRPRPTPPSWLVRQSDTILALIKRNKVKSIFGALTMVFGLLAVLPTGAAGASWLAGITEPWWYVSRGHLEEWGAPIILTQNTLATSIDHRLLYEQQKDLEEVKKDPAAASSPTVQKKIKELETEVSETTKRICFATGKKCPQ